MPKPLTGIYSSPIYTYINGANLDLDLLLPEPDYPEDFDWIDEDVKYIANYLYEGVNNTFFKALKTNIIKTVRYFNDPFIPLSDFPVLKVYKKNYKEDIYTAPQTPTIFVIAYALAYTNYSKLASIGTFVADEIVRLLKNGSYMEKFQLTDEDGIEVEFEDFINPENVIYKYTTITVGLYTCPEELVDP